MLVQMSFSKIQIYAKSTQCMGHIYPQNTMLHSFAVVSRIGRAIEHQSSEKAVIYSEKRLLCRRSQRFIVENDGKMSIRLQLSSHPMAEWSVVLLEYSVCHTVLRR